MLNVIDFGATGKGQADDSEAIQRCIGVAKEHGGGSVLFPPGNYLISKPVHVDSHRITLRGEGPCSKLTLTTGEASIRFGAKTDLRDCTLCEISNLEIIRTSNNDDKFESAAIFIEKARHTKIHNINFLEKNTCVRIGVPGSKDPIPCQWINIESCWMVGPACGVNFLNGADYTLDKTVIEPTITGIWMQGNSNGIFVTNTKILNGGEFGYGIICEGSGFARHILGCNIENALDQQIYLTGDCSRIRISNCWLGAGDTKRRRAGDKLTGRIGIFIDGIQSKVGPSEIWITGNRIGDQIGPGVIVRRADSVMVCENAITGNVNLNDPEASVELEGATNVTITNNKISSNSHKYGIRLRHYGEFNSNNIIASHNNFEIKGNHVQEATVKNDARGCIFINGSNL